MMPMNIDSFHYPLIERSLSRVEEMHRIASWLKSFSLCMALLIAAVVLWIDSASALSFDYNFQTKPNDLNMQSFFSDSGIPPGYSIDSNNGIRNGKLRLTGANREWQRTSVWRKDRHSVADGFETTFKFRISDLNETGSSDSNGFFGGEGFAFVVQNQSSDAIADFGGRDLGYGSIKKSLAIEFDTWDNTDDFLNFGGNPDLVDAESSNHISVQAISASDDPNKGEFPENSLGDSSNIPDLSSGEEFTARIRYESSDLEVFLNSEPVLNVGSIRLGDLLSEDSAWVGFTGATGSSWQNQDILDWSFTELPRESDPGPRTKIPEPESWLGAAIATVGVGVWWWRQRLPKRKTLEGGSF
jgi:hypothetical protein